MTTDIFNAPFAPDDLDLAQDLLSATRLDRTASEAVRGRARGLIEAIRSADRGLGGVEDFLREYALSTREGLALMTLAEALLRVPDAATADRLIEDKLTRADFAHHEGHGEAWLVEASTWALGLANRIVSPGETPAALLNSLVRRIGTPAVRAATRQAMRIMGHQFVLAETIEGALDRARKQRAEGYRHSFDMLGEGARTQEDARRYHQSYADAIEAIGRKAGNAALPDRPGISVKLSALYPRYEALHEGAVLAHLVPRLLELARAAKAHDLNFTVDAEEADRLELSLDVITRAVADPSLAGWDGFGLAIQAYQKRALAVIDHIDALAKAHGRRFMVRLVKGAYWDSEIKRAQERGLDGYPVFTRKAVTDLSYLACARRLLSARPRLFPQFATHNALSVAEIVTLAGGTDGYEFQRLHGMGEGLYEALQKQERGAACRIYAPVGGHRDLLAYLVRRLLENGANSSFVAAVGDEDIAVDSLLVRPSEDIARNGVMHPDIPAPRDVLGGRLLARGLEPGLRSMRATLRQALDEAPLVTTARPTGEGTPATGTERKLFSPCDASTPAGSVIEADAATARAAMQAAAAGRASIAALSAEARASALERAAAMMEGELERLAALMAREAGKTLLDGIADAREAVDFCRYYAGEARRLFSGTTAMPGPTGESNLFRLKPRGVIVAISPWNFPLAIFTGQVTAALAAGNAVVAKPAEQTPLSAMRAVEILHAAGIPRAALHLVPGDGRVGAALVADPACDGVVFTGSTETARIINRTLAQRDGPIVPLIAETGGINAMIVDATALPEQVADDVVASAFRSAGQRCSALRLLFLQEDIAERMEAMIVGAARALVIGHAEDPASDVGPVIDSDAQRTIAAHVAGWRERGRVIFEGTRPGGALAQGHYVPPTIIRLEDAQELTREVFGPVLHIVRYKAGALDRVLETIRASGFALTLGIHSRIESKVDEIVAAMDTGNIYVNRNQIGAVVGVQPFGGSGLSGTGPKAGGPHYVARFAIEQVVTVNTAAAGGNASLIAISDR